MNQKRESTIHILVGLLLIAAGVLFILDRPPLAGLITAIGLLIEALKNWIK